MTTTRPPTQPATTGGMVRARHPQMMISLAAERMPLLGEQVRASLPPDTLDLLSVAAPSMWIPIEHDIRAVEAVCRQVGQVTHDSLLQERARREMGSPLFKSFVGTVLRLFGDSAATVVKQIGNGWPQVFQDAGTYEVLGIVDDSATAVLRGVPPACLASSVWVKGVPVALETLFELVNATATIGSTVGPRGDLLLSFAWRRGGRNSATPR